MSEEIKPLKPCPFCGSTKLLPNGGTEDRGRIWRGYCDDCGTFGPVKGSEVKAIAAWNSRPEELADLKEAIETEYGKYGALGFESSVLAEFLTLMIWRDQERDKLRDWQKRAVDALLNIECEACGVAPTQCENCTQAEKLIEEAK